MQYVCIKQTKRLKKGINIHDQLFTIHTPSGYEKSRQTDEVKSKLNQEIAKLDEKMKRLTRMRLDDEISKVDYLEYKSEIERDREKLFNKELLLRRVLNRTAVVKARKGKYRIFFCKKWILRNISYRPRGNFSVCGYCNTKNRNLL